MQRRACRSARRLVVAAALATLGLAGTTSSARSATTFCVGGGPGCFATLQAAIAHYASGGKGPLKADQLNGFTLSGSETADLVAFLDSLTDTAFVSNPAFGDPRKEE